MNIFVLDHDIQSCVRYHCDRHIVKMMTEYVQLLSSALILSGETAPYKLTHKNHPCAIWARESLSNYLWLWDLANEVGKEYTYRYGKIHLSHSRLLEGCKRNIKLPENGLTPFVNCTTHKDIPNIVEAYREYYRTDKKDFITWKNREIPEWL